MPVSIVGHEQITVNESLAQEYLMNIFTLGLYNQRKGVIKCCEVELI